MGEKELRVCLVYPSSKAALDPGIVSYLHLIAQGPWPGLAFVCVGPCLLLV